MQARSLLVVCAGVLAFAVAGGAAAARTPIPGIRTPSGNITCLLVPGTPAMLRCSIRQAVYAATLQARCLAPNGSGVDWHGFELSPARKGAVTCSGGILYSPATQRPVYTVLPYGRAWRKGAFTCVSRRTGLTCRNSRGHGLFLARESWRAW